jgi:hypothetical protein
LRFGAQVVSLLLFDSIAILTDWSIYGSDAIFSSDNLSEMINLVFGAACNRRGKHEGGRQNRRGDPVVDFYPHQARGALFRA